MDLLEREAQREVIQKAMVRVRQGQGCILLVSGEAGVGKTSLIADFTAPYRAAGQVFWGACDPLFTPRPLGPLYDIALQKIPGLLDLLNAGADWLTVSLELLKALSQHPGEAVAVFEDVHWADEATLDLLKYLGRRIAQTHSLFILSYREDEAGARQALQRTIGDFPGEQTIRLPLEPLSQAAVAQLARKAGRPAEEIYQATRGNPFFVTEVLRSPGEQIPKTVRDAVLARAAHLSAPARNVLELVSISPGPIPLGLLEKILQPERADVDASASIDAAASIDADASIDACVEGGFLIPSGNSLSFRHELARLAISESISLNRARKLHQKILLALREQESSALPRVPLALLVHHAVGAQSEALVLEYAPRAAQEASHHGAHREAARYFQAALGTAQPLTPDQHARLLDGLSFECYLTGQLDEAFRLREEALQFWRQAGQVERMGDDTRWLSRLAWFQGKKQAAERYAREAIDLLEQLPPGQALAMAYSNQSQLYMLAEETEPAVAWGNRALKIAQAIRDDEISVHALTNIGTAELFAGNINGLKKLEQALALARDQELHDHVARCYANIAGFAVMQRDYPLAETYLPQGIAYTTDRDMDSYSIYLRGWQARMHFERGAWAEALQDAEEVLRSNPGSAVMALPAVTTLGYVKMRQGDPQAARWLDQARDMALPTGELQRLGPVAAARAEAAWWNGDHKQVLAEASLAYDLARQAADAWQLGQMIFWIWRAGAVSAGEIAPGSIPLCYQAMIAGDWGTAAAEWERLGCPYERAISLSMGDAGAQLQALAIFEALGAQPAARALREQLRLAGVKGLPRGPRPATQANPEGLTIREMEILALLVEGLSNAEISRRLSITPKTVDHHVSAILSKLDVHSRLEAAAAARQKNLITRQNREPGSTK